MTLRSANETSRQDIGRGRYDRPAGPLDVRKQYNPHTEIIRMPAGSIVSIPRLEASLEPLDPPSPGFYGALMFALPVSIFLWVLIGFAAWGLLSVFR